MTPGCRIEHTSWHLNSPVFPILRLTLGLLVIAWLNGSAHACLGCFRLPYRSLLEKVESSDRVVVAHPVNPSETSWKIDHVIKGQNPGNNERLDVSDSTPHIPGPQVLRWDRASRSWMVDCPASQELVAFLKRGVELSAGLEQLPVRQQAQRLRYYLTYLEHADAQIADSAHARLAKTPYVVLRELAPHLDHDRLVTWITAQRTAIKQRGALYLTLLGRCGDERTAALLQEWIDQRWAGSDAGYLAALLTAHLEVNGEVAVRFIEESYIKSGDRSLGEIVAAVDALRTHGQAGARISRERIKASFHLLLRERPPLAELVIDDFARWKDWSIATRLMEIYAGGEQPWNNAMIIRYLQACPLPSAKDFLNRVSGDTEGTDAID